MALQVVYGPVTCGPWSLACSSPSLSRQILLFWPGPARAGQGWVTWQWETSRGGMGRILSKVLEGGVGVGGHLISSEVNLHV